MEAYNELLKQAKKPERPPYGNPWNPSYIIVISFFLPFLGTSIGLALNWRRLGKKQWALPTFLIGIISTIILVVSFIAGIPYFDFNSRLSMSLFAFWVATPISFFVGVTYLQAVAYQKWREEYDLNVLMTHQYEWRKAFAVIALLVCVIIGYANLKFSPDIPQVYQGNQFSVEYRKFWTPLDREKVCPYGCELVLGDSKTNYTTILFEQFPIGQATSSKGLYQKIWSGLLKEHPNYTVVNSIENFKVGGRDAVYVEYFEKHDDGKDQAYFGQYFVSLGQMAVIVTAQSDIPGIFREDRKQIEEVINSIQFSNGSKPV